MATITRAGIDHTTEYGEGCEFVMPLNIYGSKLGDRVKVGPFVEIQDDCIIGDETVIQSHSFIAAGTKIGKRVFVGHGVMFCNDKYPVAGNRDWVCEPVFVGDNASIGSGAVILPGVVIGNSARVGAGAVVTKNVAPKQTVVGIH